MIDCSQKEIADAVNEMLLRLDGNWIDNEDTIRLQKKFQSHNWKNIYGLRGHEVEFYHDKIRGKYSTNFLLNNQHWVNC